MKVAIYLLGLGIAASTISLGVAGLQAQQSTLMNYCPADSTPGTCSAAAAMLVSAGHPSDDQLIAYITAIAGAKGKSGGCADTAAGLSALAGAIDNAASRALALQVAERLCGPSRGSTAAADVTGFGMTPSGATNMEAGQPAPPKSSCGSSGSSGSTSGETSGGTSGSSGSTSGDASGGTSGETSGGTSGSAC